MKNFLHWHRVTYNTMIGLIMFACCSNSVARITPLQIDEVKQVFSKYILDEVSGLSHHLPLSDYKAFDPDDIEVGRLYFWIKKNPKDILQSEIIFFVLQDRYNLTFMIEDELTLATFNDTYNIIDLKQYDSDREGYNLLYDDHLEWMQKKIREQDFKEISQEEIISILTGRKSSDILQQKPIFSIYFTDKIYDIYDGMIQIWSAYNNDTSFSIAYSTAFFSDKKSEEEYLHKQLNTEIKDEYELQHKVQVKQRLDMVAKAHQQNLTHKQRLLQRKNILKKFPKLQTFLSLDIIHQLEIETNLKIINGDYSVDGDLMLCEKEKSSLLITGDLKVKGSLFFTKGCRKKILIVIGKVEAEHFIYDYSSYYYPPVFVNDLNITGVTYIKAASRYRSINIGGHLKTQSLIHNQRLLIDPLIFFEAQYHLQDLTDDILNSRGQVDKALLFQYLKQKKNIFRESLKKGIFNKTELADAFSLYLSEWGSLFYRFAGFEHLEYANGEYAESCHVGSGDQVLIDMRTQSGRYCINHDTLELTALDNWQEKREIKPSSVKLAYQFYWIMWTFSNWEHRNDGPLDYWKSPQQIDKAFENGKPYLKDDPYLALYWILHFGLLDDKRYQVVKEIMINSKHGLIKGAIAFIDSYRETGTFPKYLRAHVNTSLVNKRIKKHIEDLRKIPGACPRMDTVARESYF